METADFDSWDKQFVEIDLHTKSCEFTSHRIFPCGVYSPWVTDGRS